MNFSEITEQAKELRKTRKLFKSVLKERFAHLGHYPVRIRVDSDQVAISTSKELTEIEISAIEDDYGLRLTLSNKNSIKNIDEGFYYLGGVGEFKVFKYIFREALNGD